MEIATDQGWFEGDCEKIVKLLPPINGAVFRYRRECKKKRDFFFRYKKAPDHHGACKGVLARYGRR